MAEWLSQHPAKVFSSEARVQISVVSYVIFCSSKIVGKATRENPFYLVRNFERCLSPFWDFPVEKGTALSSCKIDSLAAMHHNPSAQNEPGSEGRNCFEALTRLSPLFSVLSNVRASFNPVDTDISKLVAEDSRSEVKDSSLRKSL